MAKSSVLFKTFSFPIHLCDTHIKVFLVLSKRWYYLNSDVKLVSIRCSKDLEHKLKVVISSLFLHLSSTVSKETEITTYTNIHKNPPDTQVNQCLPSSQTANQPVTRQTAQAPGKENMLFFWASLNFTAYKTQPHRAHPTHGEIKAPLSHRKPTVTRPHPRKLRSGFASLHPQVQAH